ncbi:unnamed protein product, partial [Prorocentrum cordatum]
TPQSLHRRAHIAHAVLAHCWGVRAGQHDLASWPSHRSHEGLQRAAPGLLQVRTADRGGRRVLLPAALRPRGPAGGALGGRAAGPARPGPQLPVARRGRAGDAPRQLLQVAGAGLPPGLGHGSAPVGRQVQRAGLRELAARLQPQHDARGQGPAVLGQRRPGQASARLAGGAALALRRAPGGRRGSPAAQRARRPCWTPCAGTASRCCPGRRARWRRGRQGRRCRTCGSASPSARSTTARRWAASAPSPLDCPELPARRGLRASAPPPPTRGRPRLELRSPSPPPPPPLLLLLLLLLRSDI